MKTLDELNGYDKAAIIFDILGESLSINMFKDIPEAEFYKLRDHAKSLKNTVSTSVKKEVLEDYYFKMLSKDKYKDQTSSEKMFEFLEALDDEQLFVLLSPEKPRVIALALEQIDNEKRMIFLSKVNVEKQNKIVLQTGELNDIPLEAIIHTANELKKKCAFLPESVPLHLIQLYFLLQNLPLFRIPVQHFPVSIPLRDFPLFREFSAFLH